MSLSARTKDRVLGCLVGGAIGDAFGSPYEGATPPINIAPAFEPFLTDDTCLTLATCEAITTQGHVDPGAIAERCAARFRTGQIVGMAGQIAGALLGFERLPQKLVRQVPEVGVILNTAEYLAALVDRAE